jgi:hypothetical protein
VDAALEARHLCTSAAAQPLLLGELACLMVALLLLLLC